MRNLANRFLRPAGGLLLLAPVLLSLSGSGAAAKAPQNSSAAQALENAIVQDIFGRTVNENGIVLVDWEGYMANPALQLSVQGPPNAVFPVTALLTANHARLYFDRPSDVGAAGPSKTITLPDASSRAPILLSVFPDRDGENEERLLTIRSRDATGDENTTTVPIRIMDQDADQPAAFRIILDFSHDRTGFFDDPAKREIVRVAAADWAYFIADMNLDEVAADAELTFIWDPDMQGGQFVRNRDPYLGYLLYSYGIHTDRLVSGGAPSFEGGFQSSGGSALPIRRSGGIQMETAGNFNELGWYLATGDDDWWISGNLGDEQNDFYSITHHEMGHAFFFNPAHTRFGEFKDRGSLEDPAVLAYHGSNPRIDQFDHFDGEIDRASRIGAFGYEYFGNVPRKRWLITKLDLLCAQAIGYRLRETSAFVPLSITDAELLPGTVSVPYSDRLEARGGIPFYNWSVESGSLPEGLSLNSFTGIVSGTPTQAGTFPFTVNVRDYESGTPGVSTSTSITIN